MGWRLRWYEEPVVQEDLDGYAEVRRALATPIAGGENEYTALRLPQFSSPRARVDIAQPDLCIAGGFTACRHIVALAHAHGVQVNPHVWASAVGQAASLQFIASIPVANHSLFPKRHPARVRYLVASVPRAPHRHAAAPAWRLGGYPGEAGARHRGRSQNNREVFRLERRRDSDPGREGLHRRLDEGALPPANSRIASIKSRPG